MRVDMVLVNLPHYRGHLVSALESTPTLEVTWLTGVSTRSSKFKMPQTDAAIKRHRLVRNRVFRLPFGRGRVIWQGGVVRHAIVSNARSVIITGDPLILSTWPAALIYRLKGVRVLMWTHGWLRLEGGFKKFARLCFYNLADGLLLFNERSARIGRDLGYRKGIEVIYNSTVASVPELRRAPDNDHPSTAQRWIIVGRLNQNKGFERAIEAAAVLGESSRVVELIIVGEGPMEELLRERAGSLGVKAEFVGAVYDLDLMNSYLDRSDILVSPLNVGLSAMQALARGVPVATSEDLDVQMPEAEAVQAGVTGVFFDPNSISEMAESIWRFVETSDRETVFDSCIAEFTERWSGDVQSRRMTAALLRESRR